MARSKLGPMPDEWFENDIPNIPDADKAYGPKFHDRMDKLAERIAQARDRAQVEKAYDPNQPRAPKGSPEGGRWIDADSGGVLTREKAMELMKEVVVFHGTTEEALESILEKGLIPQSGTRGADAWAAASGMVGKDIILMAADLYPDRKASVFVTAKQVVAFQYAKWATEVNPGSKGLMLAIQVPEEAHSTFDDDEMSGDPTGSGLLASMRRKGGIPREWIKAYRVIDRDDETSKVDKADGGRTLYAVVICQPRGGAAKASGSEEFFAELLNEEDAAIEQVIDQTKQRMGARGLSQEAIDLAYGKPKK